MVIFLIKRMVENELIIDYFSSKRSLLVTEIMDKLKTIKTDRFEEYFEKKVKEVREKELVYLKSKANIQAFSDFFIGMSTVVIILLI